MGIKRRVYLIITGLIVYTVLFSGMAFYFSRRSPEHTGGTVIVCAGDSITAASYPRYLQEQFTQAGVAVKVINRGRPGHTSGEYLRYLRKARWMGRDNPDFILLQLGTNDVRIDGDQTDVAAFERNMSLLIQEMSAHVTPGKRPVRILIAKIPPVTAAAPLFDEHSRARVVEEINPAVEKLAEKRELVLVDNYKLFVEHPEWLPGIHPNERGYQAIAEQWFRVLLPLVNPDYSHGSFDD